MTTETTDKRGRTPTFNSWRAMIRRCLNPNEEKHKRNYAKRGITICDRWLGDGGFANFLADMGPRPSGHFLDRVDTNGNYCPENCRWVTHSQNMRNTRSNVFVEWGGKRMTIIELSECTGVPYDNLRRRIVDRKWPIDRAVGEPFITGRRPGRPNRHLTKETIGDLTMSRAEWYRKLGIKKDAVLRRIRKGMTFEQAIASILNKRTA